MDDPLGLVFDIEEFAIYDGPGIRCAIFLKGCPLRCAWCHNPEGLEAKPQRSVNKNLCVHCGKCERVCPTPGNCTACGKCINVCEKGAIRIVGTYMRASEAAAKVKRHEQVLKMNGGGVTFSGGEVLLQPDFVIAVREKLSGLHAAIETSGYAPGDVFARVAERMNLVMFDIKHPDPVQHKKWTGHDNAMILSNLERLKKMDVPFRARIPVIPGVNDSGGDLEKTARLLDGARNLECVELLRYNRSAGAKYALLNKEYRPAFDEGAEPNMNTEIFEKYGIKAVIL